MTTTNTGAASLSDEQKSAAITACALMIKGICLTTPNAEWAERIEKRIRFMLRQIATTPQADAAPSDDGLIPRPDLERDPLWQWRCIANEAEVAVNHKGKFLMLSEEMCVRLGAALEDAAIAAGGAQEPVGWAIKYVNSDILEFNFETGDEPSEEDRAFAKGHGQEYVPLYTAPLPGEAATVPLTADDADMVWPDDDGETFFHAIDDAVENEVNNAWPVDVEPPANGELELKLQLAKRIPTATIRIFNITENGHEWEIVAPAAASNGEQ